MNFVAMHGFNPYYAGVLEGPLKEEIRAAAPIIEIPVYNLEDDKKEQIKYSRAKNKRNTRTLIQDYENERDEEDEIDF